MNKTDEKRYTQDQVDLAKMAMKLDNIESTVTTMSKKLDADYVTKDEIKVVQLQLDLVQRIVYGVVGLILTSVLGGMIVFYINAAK